MNHHAVSHQRDAAMAKLVTFLQDESGANAIEYVLIGALLGVAIIGAVTTFTADVGSLFQTVSNNL
jgi:Flp pilus assembly pilin Flp